MAQFENVAMSEKGVIESIVGLTPNEDGTFTIKAVKEYPRKKNKIMEMTFTRNGLAAIVGTWQAALEFGVNND